MVVCRDQWTGVRPRVILPSLPLSEVWRDFSSEDVSHCEESFWQDVWTMTRVHQYLRRGGGGLTSVSIPKQRLLLIHVFSTSATSQYPQLLRQCNLSDHKCVSNSTSKTETHQTQWMIQQTQFVCYCIARTVCYMDTHYEKYLWNVECINLLIYLFCFYKRNKCYLLLLCDVFRVCQSFKLYNVYFHTKAVKDLGGLNCKSRMVLIGVHTSPLPLDLNNSCI